MTVKFSIFITNTSRSLTYLKYLKKNNLNPEIIIYLDNYEKVYSKILKKKKFLFPKIKVIKIFGKTINSKKFYFIKKLNSDFIIFSGYSGDIVKKNILSLKNFIHCHPGKLPQYKGSTTIYYSILRESKIYCSAIVLNKNIDEGDVLFTEKFHIPNNIFSIDKNYDDKIRAITLVNTLKKINKLKLKKQKKNNYSHYFVIHPVLRSIVFKKKFIQNNAVKKN